MAVDHVPITAGAGTSIATDAIADADAAGVVRHYQRVKIETGPDGVAADVSNANPWPNRDLSVGQLLSAVLVELRVLTTMLADQCDPTLDLEAIRREHWDSPDINGG